MDSPENITAQTTPSDSPLLTPQSISNTLPSISMDAAKQLTAKRIFKRPSRKNSLGPPKVEINHPRVASFAFAFDIDGVLVRGPETIPQAPLALKMLNGENKYNIKIPYIFVTNGGGKTEEMRCKDLSERLQVPVSCDQFIQGHTPMRDLKDKYKTVLVIGGIGEACRLVAENYGFEDVVTPGDILKWNPHVSPFRTLTDEEYKNSRERDFSKTNIEAILVFADSREWAADQQIILELLMSKNGVMGTVSETFEEGPPIYFAHSDFVWATNYNLSRYGMGALQVTISALYKNHTGKELTVNRFGKPHKDTFKYATKVLKRWRQNTYDSHFSPSRPSSPTEGSTSITGQTLVSEPVEDSITGKSLVSEPTEDLNITGSAIVAEPISDSDEPLTEGDFVDEPEADENNDEAEMENEIHDKILNTLPEADTVYFVGDTPESDIRFANSFDDKWYSILVKTGVYQEGTEPAYKPKIIVDNVLSAVEYAIEREHQKELEQYNKVVDAGIELPVEHTDLQPHMVSSLLEKLELKEKIEPQEKVVVA